MIMPFAQPKQQVISREFQSSCSNMANQGLGPTMVAPNDVMTLKSKLQMDETKLRAQIA